MPPKHLRHIAPTTSPATSRHRTPPPRAQPVRSGTPPNEKVNILDLVNEYKREGYTVVEFEPGKGEDPREFGRAHKWFITAATSFLCLAVALGSSIITGDLEPYVGPLVGGWTGQKAGWRWIYWVLFIFVGISFVFTLFIPETLSPVLLRRKAARLRKETGDSRYTTLAEIEAEPFLRKLRVAIERPMIMLFTELIVILMSFSIQETRGWSLGATGTSFISITIGILGALCLMHQQEKVYRKMTADGSFPEACLYPMMIRACTILPIALLVFAFTGVFPWVHWIGVCAADVLFGMAMIIIYISTNSYIIDSHSSFAASALAAKTLMRSLCGAMVPLYVVYMFHNMGFQYDGLLLGLVACVIAPMPFRCDGMRGPGTRCANCIDYGMACTYSEAAKKRGPPKSYVQRLESRIERLQDLLAKISPEALEHLETLPDGPISTISSFSNHHTHTQPQWPPHIPTPGRFISQLGSGRIPPFTLAPSEEDDPEDFLVDHLEKLHIHSKAQRFFGKSSGVMLIKTALELKQNYLDGRVGAGESRDGAVSGEIAVRQWMHPLPAHSPPPPKYTFPPSDLLDDLIELYFLHMNTYLPLLHRPTFTQAVKDGLHLRDTPFATTVMLVCAVAGRYSDDPRVMDDLTGQEDEDASGEEAAGEGKARARGAHSCGWKWFSQVSLIKTSPLSPPSLHELQFYALVGQFLQASSVPQACWTVVGMGVRVAQDVGAHRRNIRGPHTVEDELWKRAFWVLVCMDRLFSSSLGRPCSIHDEDFDVEMPIECDDEYWEHPDPELRWQQPTAEKTPSLVVYFNEYIRLNQILALLLRTVYAINKSKILLGFVGQQWEESIVSELDSALNAWVDNLPDHRAFYLDSFLKAAPSNLQRTVRWDPTRAHPAFFNQSASLYCAYHNIQILVHRPFIPSPRKAATAAFSSGVVLLLSIWGGKRAGLSTDFDREMADVKKCMDVLKGSETRCDILCELASVGDLPLPQRSSVSPAGTAQKRDREDESELQPNRETKVETSTTNTMTYEDPAVSGVDTMPASRTMIGRTGSVRQQGSNISLGTAASVPLPLPQGQLYTFGEYETFDSEPAYAPVAPYQPHLQQSLQHQRLSRQAQYPQQYQRHQHQHHSTAAPLHDGLVHPEHWYGPMGGGSPHGPAYVPSHHSQPPHSLRQRHSHIQSHSQSQPQSHSQSQPQSHSQAHSIAAGPSRSASSSGPGARVGMGLGLEREKEYTASYYEPSAANLGEMSPFAAETPTGEESANTYRMGIEASRSGNSAITMSAGEGMSDAPGMVAETFGLWSGAPAGFECVFVLIGERSSR
ncbi:hypothetical protein DXG03_000941 [Asterophora parasitica]|uniref:Xylanolytic transcriptional activator regulatory domain-containing protein n=1 Tax=Asterophora parasitica TaxID=117018 RepID=A0A9P7G4K3_9AGAR|nr:hypothetical protein DXG03_000941 [Asterophora parasitica]